MGCRGIWSGGRPRVPGKMGWGRPDDKRPSRPPQYPAAVNLTR
jgi:hypothetical protein